MRKILFITNIPSPYRVNFFNELGKAVDLTVVFEARNFTNRNVNWTENTAKTFREIYLQDGIVTDNQKGNNQVTQLIEKDKYDLIVASEYGAKTLQIAIKYMKKHKIPFILNADGGFIRQKENILKKFYKKMLVSSASHWITSGAYSGKTLQHYGAKQEHIRFYPFTSVRAEEIQRLTANERADLKQKLNLPHDKKIVISVGQFIERKGMDVLIKSACLVKEDVLYLLVGGEPTQEYQKMIAEHSIENIKFIPHLKRSELFEYYQCADLFALMTREDIWGLVINEAMANGLPVITTNKCIAGIEMIKDGANGFLINVDDEKVLAEKIDYICASADRLKEMSEHALSTARDYTIEKMAQAHRDIFEEILK